MKGKQTGQLRQKAEGQYLLYAPRLCVLCHTTIKFFFLRLAEKWIKMFHLYKKCFRKKRESSSVLKIKYAFCAVKISYVDRINNLET